MSGGRALQQSAIWGLLLVTSGVELMNRQPNASRLTGCSSRRAAATWALFGVDDVIREARGAVIGHLYL